MGKIDDMRRQREARLAGTPPTAAPADDADAADGDADAAPSDADSGLCSVCKKTKPMHQGIIASHQKGLGKMCPGSRKPPA